MSTAATPPTANLLIAGVGKSGTTSLFRYLAQHPDVCGSSVKETHYFSPLRTGGTLPPIAAYRRYFAHWAGERYCLEASPDYCVGGAPLRRALDEHLIEPRVTIVLRDPVDRLWDNYWYMKSKSRLPDVHSFEQYVEAGLARRRVTAVSDVAAEHSGWARSFYGDFVGAWLDDFGPRLRLVFFDDLAADPAAVVADLCAWLDLDPAPAAAIDYRIHNRTVEHRSALLHRYARKAADTGRTALERRPRLRRRLGELYAAANQTAAPPRAMQTATRAALEEATRESNRRLTRVMVEHGYTRLPGWLTTEEPAAAGDGR